MTMLTKWFVYLTDYFSSLCIFNDLLVIILLFVYDSFQIYSFF